MFGCAHELFEMIPRICQLGVECYQNKLGVFSASRHSYLYFALEGKIQTWKPSHRNGVPYPGHLLLAAEIYKRALLIFLHTAFYSPRVTEPLLRSSVGAMIVQAIPLFAQMETWPTLDSHGRTREPAITITLL